MQLPVDLLTFPKWNTMHCKLFSVQRFAHCCSRESLMFDHQKLWSNAPSPMQVWGQEKNGDCGSLRPAASCPGLDSFFETKDRWGDFKTRDRQGVAEEDEFILRYLPTSPPITHCGRPYPSQRASRAVPA